MAVNDKESEAWAEDMYATFWTAHQVHSPTPWANADCITREGFRRCAQLALRRRDDAVARARGDRGPW